MVAQSLRYTVLLDPDPDGGFTVTVPAIPSVVTEGDTRDEALANAREAIALALEAMAADGEIPPLQIGEIQIEHVEILV